MPPTFEDEILHAGLAPHAEYAKALVRPAVHIELGAEEPAVGASKYGGWPDLPPGTAWPKHPEGGPYQFVAQIDCAAIEPRSALLPSRGLLCLFSAHPADEKFWGDEGYVHALYFESPAELQRTPAPPLTAAQRATMVGDSEAGLEFEEQSDSEALKRMERPDVYPAPERGVRFVVGDDIPHAAEQRADWPAPADEFLDALWSCWKLARGEQVHPVSPEHRVEPGQQGRSFVERTPHRVPSAQNVRRPLVLAQVER